MSNKPAMYGERFASAFMDADTVAAYQYRPPYPPQTFELLTGLLADEPKRVLDVGCGTGFIARPLVQWRDDIAVDALDISSAMIESARLLPGGMHPRLRWLVGRAEDISSDQLSSPYALITAGDSIHWLDWQVALPRFADLLSDNGHLAIVGNGQLPTPWDTALQAVLGKYSVYGDLYQPIDVIAELERQELFQPEGSVQTQPVLFSQSVADYAASFHGRAGCARSRMAATITQEFAHAVQSVIEPFIGKQTQVNLMTYATITWGKPRQRSVAHTK